MTLSAHDLFAILPELLVILAACAVLALDPITPPSRKDGLAWLSLGTMAVCMGLTAARMSAKAVDNIKQVTWEKLVQIGLASSWSVSNLAGGDFYFIDGITVREGAESYMQIGLELLSVYRALGYEPQDFYAPMTQFRDLEKGSFDEGVALLMAWGNQLKAANMKSRTSMHVDFTRGRKLEVDEIIKPFIDKARELRIAIPTVVAAYRTIKLLDHYLK